MNREKVLSYLTNPKATSIIDSLRAIFKDLPHLPAKVREILVQIIPWLAIVGAVLSAIGGVQDLLFAFGIGSAPYDFGNPLYWLVYGVLSLVSAYIAFLSFPLLREKKYTGWILLFWGAVISLVMSALSLFFSTSFIVGFIISVAISFYLTFEIEPAYTGTVKEATTEAEKTKSSQKITQSK